MKQNTHSKYLTGSAATYIQQWCECPCMAMCFIYYITNNSVQIWVHSNNSLDIAMIILFWIYYRVQGYNKSKLIEEQNQAKAE